MKNRLLVITYENPYRAEEVFAALRRMQKDELIILEETAVIIKDEQGKLKFPSGLDTTVAGVVETAKNTTLGLLVGLVFGLPFIGALTFIAGGLLWRRLSEHNVDAEFINTFSTNLQPGCSALMVLADAGPKAVDQTDRLLQELRPLLIDGTIIRNELSEQAKATIEALMQDETGILPAHQVAQIQRVQVIVNPSSGIERPILKPINAVFHPANIDWDVSITRKSGDVQRLTREAVAAGVDAVAIYGGDGSVMEAASALIGTDVPLAILPGGTGNVASIELGIPYDLRQATSLICRERNRVRSVDMGLVGEQHFILRVATGYEAGMVQGASREAKDRLGSMAYVLSAIQQPMRSVRYLLTLDGKPVEAEGVTCIVANSGNFGVPGMPLLSGISVSDGLLDVLVIRQGELASLLKHGDDDSEAKKRFVQHWQVHDVTVATEQPESVIGDGEVWDDTPFTAQVLPQAVRIIVP
ncbi:MAG: DUF1269 domain-containing protein [Chloroflexaceae bacterium]|nr:DUF1269 domain-containing protein [Chloroflexaceae bacterium]